MAADKICCVSGCTKSREDGYVTKPKRTQISTKINVLKKKLKSMNIENEKYSKMLKKAMNLSENTTFLKAIKSFTSIATIFTMLQFRECGKHKMGR
ncbi:unnamed protein product [Parnassius apollo]|uniref:(apollo) hypothetical protein n=1 Tax=Parnassius apollo TaxID=110799 RepID=A0A8S3X867_PARAO|nr:unnamed protein product [Parnassius apollo]